MPRGRRLDAPGTLHAVRVREIDRRRLFETTANRQDFEARRDAVGGRGLQVLGWTLLPTHVHLRVRTGGQPLATAMRRLLTGYAATCNHRHQRDEHPFQNRTSRVWWRRSRTEGASRT